MNAYNFVWGYLYPFLWDVIHAAGYGSDSVDNVYNWLSRFRGTIWESILVAALLPPIALWMFSKNQVGGIQSILNWLNSFVRYTVAPLWSWLIATVQSVASQLQHISDVIWTVVWQFWAWLSPQMWNAVNALQSRIDSLSRLLASDIQNALAWVTTQLNNLQVLISTDVQNALAWVTTQLNNLQVLISTDVQNALTWVTTQLGNLQTLITTDVQNAIAWVATQFNNLQTLLGQISTNIETWVGAFVNGALAQLTAQIQPLLDFLSWWQNDGKKTLVEFVNDPATFMLDVIADKFISWFADLLERNW